jgi:HEXXH motif-containing protein
VTSGLDRFVAPQGDPETIQRLAWRRSALRFRILLTLRRERPSDELSYLLDQLESISAFARHRALAAPEMALFIEALLNDGTPQAEIAAPILARISSACSNQAHQKFSWPGKLPLDYLPLGVCAVRVPGEELREPELLLDDQQVTLSSPWGGPTIKVPLNATRIALENCFLRSDRLEIVDGWKPFCNDFDDGNESVNLNLSARGTLRSLISEAVTLIKAVLPAVLEEMLETAQYLSPIRPKSTGTTHLPSFSTPGLPGVIFVGIQQGDGTWIDAEHLAESCIHEHLHNRLYLLDEAAPLTLRTENPRAYFSPWKKTMRSIEGMLHAIYVFSHLAWFWNKVGTKFPELDQYATRCVEEQVENLQTATAEIDTDELTEAGCRILAASTEILADLTTEA